MGAWVVIYFFPFKMMKWLQEYHLFLFDFDGLLVNTERIHFEAYRLMCQHRGFDMTWDFAFYSTIAHYHATGIEGAIYSSFPELKQMEPNWPVLYQEKTSQFLNLVEKGKVELMPGAFELLTLLRKREKRSLCGDPFTKKIDSGHLETSSHSSNDSPLDYKRRLSSAKTCTGLLQDSFL